MWGGNAVARALRNAPVAPYLLKLSRGRAAVARARAALGAASARPRMSLSGRYVIALPVVVAGYAIVAGYALPALRRLWLRRRDLVGAPATVNSAEEWAALGAARSGTRPGEVGLFAFYSSVAGAITTAPELMTLPIDDHAIVRGHAVFDTCTLACGRMYRLLTPTLSLTLTLSLSLTLTLILTLTLTLALILTPP